MPSNPASIDRKDILFGLAIITAAIALGLTGVSLGMKILIPASLIAVAVIAAVVPLKRAPNNTLTGADPHS